jgi:hypothetical protein
MAAYIYEFLYRGPQPHNDGKGAWHVVLGNDVDDGFGHKRTLLSTPMNPTQAAAAGFDLKTILADINTEVMVQHDKLKARLGEIGEKP